MYVLLNPTAYLYSIDDSLSKTFLFSSFFLFAVIRSKKQKVLSKDAQYMRPDAGCYKYMHLSVWHREHYCTITTSDKCNDDISNNICKYPFTHLSIASKMNGILYKRTKNRAHYLFILLPRNVKLTYY